MFRLSTVTGKGIDLTDTPQNGPISTNPHRQLLAVMEWLLSALVVPVSFRVPFLPAIRTTPAQMFRLVTSREVTWTIVAATVLCGVGPMASALLHFPDKLPFWFAVALTPFAVTYFSIAQIYLWVLFSTLLRRKPPITVHCALTTIIAATIVALIGLQTFILLPESYRPMAARINPQTGILVTAVFPLFYLLPAMLIHAFVFKHLIPIGSQRWKELGRNINAETVREIAEKRARNLFTGNTTNSIRFGDKDVPIYSIRLVEAQGNYVRILTDEGEQKARKPFLKVISKLPEARGVQLHRSRWAAFDAITEVTNEQDALFVTVQGANRIKVAKSRSESVSKALAKAGVPSKPPSELQVGD